MVEQRWPTGIRPRGKNIRIKCWKNNREVYSETIRGDAYNKADLASAVDPKDYVGIARDAKHIARFVRHRAAEPLELAAFLRAGDVLRLLLVRNLIRARIDLQHSLHAARYAVNTTI